MKALAERCSDLISLYELANETESTDKLGASGTAPKPGQFLFKFPFPAYATRIVNSCERCKFYSS